MTSDPTTWTDLKAEIAALAIRDDLTDRIPGFIAYAERIFNRSVFSPEREETVTLSFTGQSASLPADFWGVRTVYLDASQDAVLEQVTPSKLRQLYPDASAGTPAKFAIEGETMLLGPVPSTASVVLTYWQTIPALGSTQATNWLLTDHPDLYVNAALAELYEYTRDPTEADRRGAKAGAIMESINRAGRRRMTNSGPLQASGIVSQVSRYVRA
jgi:hypothetical protein